MPWRSALYKAKHAITPAHRAPRMLDPRIQGTAVAATLCAVTIPLTFARLVGGGTITPLPQLAALAPLGVVFALAALGCALAVRSLRPAVLALVLLGTHLVWLAPEVIANRPAPPRGVQSPLRLLTLNAYDGQADAGAILAAVRADDVDVLVVEELTAALDARLDQAGLVGLLPYSRALPGGGASGIGIFSRLPMTPHAHGVTGTVYPMPRAFLTLPNGERLSLTAVHTLSPRPGQVASWERDLRTVAAVAGQTRGPQLVVGDFNASRDHAAFRAILDTGVVADAADVLGPPAWPGLTWPANVPGFPPFVRLDHVLVTPDVVSVVRLATVAVRGTDHRGVLVQLAVSAPDAASAADPGAQDRK